MLNGMQGSVNVESLCLVCSAPGSHSVMRTIPPYLHENPRECSNWKKPIHSLVSEVTGVELTEGDGLPRRICVLCISYLKHAYTFRQQTINNIASLLEAQCLANVESEPKDGMDVDIGRDDDMVDMINDGYRAVNLVGMRRKHHDKSSHKTVVRHVISNGEKPQNIDLETATLLTDSELSEPEPRRGIFGYRERQFVEDDVLDVLKESSVLFSLPEDYKEKKCIACKKRFMFSESFAQHLKECLHHKLAQSIRNLYHILYLREHGAISSYEFIRRVVFAVRSSNRLLVSYTGELEETLNDTPSPTPSSPDEDHPACNGLEQARSSSERSSPVRYSSSSPTVPYRSQLSPQPNNLPSTSGLNSLHLDEFRKHESNLAVIRNRLTKTEAEEVNASNGDRYKSVKCKQCTARFFTISHLDEHTIKMHCQRLPTEPLKNGYFYLMESKKHGK